MSGFSWSRIAQTTAILGLLTGFAGRPSAHAAIVSPEGDGSRATGFERPFVAVVSGYAHLDRDATRSEIADHELLGIRIGFSKERPLPQDEAVRLYSARGLFGDRSAADLLDSETDGIATSSWRFGLSDADGAGYRIGSGSLTVMGTHANAMGWTFLDLEEADLEESNPEAFRRIDPFLDHVRFGTSWRGGLRLAPHPNLAVEADYQRAILFPATKGLDLLLSHTLEMIALEAVDPFLGAIADRSPRAVPILAFLLRGGISYAIYELRREDMHWPLDTAPPLTDDSFRFAIETVF